MNNTDAEFEDKIEGNGFSAGLKDGGKEIKGVPPAPVGAGADIVSPTTESRVPCDPDRETRSAPVVSILINTKNGESGVRRLLQTIQREPLFRRGAVEILLLDDASDPPLPALEVGRQIRNEVSGGVGAARNRLASEARGDYLMILDDDVEWTIEDLLGRSVLAVQATGDSCLIAYCEMTPEGTRSWIQPSQAMVTSWIGRFCGFAFLLPREMWQVCGGFEEILFYQYEEIDLSYRLFAHGYRILYDPSLAIVHHRKSDAASMDRVHRWILRNMLFTAVLRFPIYLIPTQWTRSIQLYLGFAQGGLASRWQGMRWSLAETWAQLPALWRRRRPVSLTALQRFRQLTRTPEAVELPHSRATPSQ